MANILNVYLTPISEIDCGEPDTVESTELEFIETSIGSEAVYTCEMGTEPAMGAVREQHVRCSEQGWGQVNMTCRGLYITNMSGRTLLGSVHN